ncbi:MAG TPA: spermidine/putrescine ABC transporter substrate-binding protein [Tepidisphaeraceae bacterium]|nr:spermidine/putrescine ABC transporter substrate-binding protein [Tepidisphaeraceae bacterium]
MKWISCLAVCLLLIASCDKGAKSITLLAWSEYVPQKVIDGFEKETGIKVHYDAIDNNEALVQKLLSGASKYDVIQPSEYIIEQLAKLNKLAVLDHSKLPNLKNIGSQYMDMPHDRGNKYSVPYMTGTVGIVVNTEKVKEPIHGYRDLFHPKYTKRIVVLNDAREMVSWALNCLGLDVNEINPRSLAKAKPILADWVRLIRVYDSDSPKTSLSNGDCDLGVVWSGEAAKLWEENQKFVYVLPEEGTHMFVDSLAIPVDAPDVDAAHQFINYCLRPEISKLISDEFPYTNPNLQARKLLSQKQLDNPASYPKGEAKLGTFRDIGKASSDVDALITNLKSQG